MSLLLSSLDPHPASRLARRARAAAFLLTGVVIFCTLAYALPIFVDDPRDPPFFNYRAIERDGDFVAWAPVFGGREETAHVRWSSNATPDRVLLLRQGDVEAVLAGQDVAPLQEFAATGVFDRGMGRLSFRVPSPDCPPPTGGCIDASMPVLVWLKGDAWRGAAVADARHHQVQNQGGGAIGWEGPVGYGVSIVNARVGVMGPVWMGVGTAAAVLATLCALTFLVAQVRLLRRAPRRDRLPLPAGAGTEEMLRVVRLSGLYVETIQRYFLVSAAFIGLATLAVVGLGYPPLLEAAKRQFQFGDAMWTAFYFLAVPLWTAGIALVFWAAAYLRVRRELREWREAARGFEEDAARILGA